MNDEARLLFALWETVNDVIPNSDRQESAGMMIRVLIEQNGCDIDLLHDAEGECPYLDRALADVAAEIAEEAAELDDYLEEDE